MGFSHLACAPVFAPHGSGDIFAVADYDAVHPALGAESSDHVIAGIAAFCAEAGLKLVFDLVVSRVAIDGRLAREHPDWFRPLRSAGSRVDPRAKPRDAHIALARFEDPAVAERLAAWWADRLQRWVDAGVTGFRCLHPQEVSVPAWQHLTTAVRTGDNPAQFFAWTPGVSWPLLPQLADVKFDGVFSSLPWWDRHASWFVEEYEILRRIAPVLGCPEAPFGERLAARLGPADDLRLAYGQALRLAAATGNGLLVPAGFDTASAEPMDDRHADAGFVEAGTRVDFSDEVRASTALAGVISERNVGGEMRILTSPANPLTALLRASADDARRAESAIAILVNTLFVTADPSRLSLAPFAPEAPAGEGQDSAWAAPLAPGEVRIIQVKRQPPVTLRGRRKDQLLQAALKAPRIVIDTIAPAIDGGRFAVKRILGEIIAVSADIFADGHDVIGAELLWSAADDADWRRIPMRHVANDRWEAEFTPVRLGRHLFTIEAWWDEYGTFSRDLKLKHDAGVDVAVELQEGRLLLAHNAGHAKDEARDVLSAALAQMAKASAAAQVGILLALETRAAVAVADERRFRVQHEPPVAIDMDPQDAVFSSWYELFPRSESGDPHRHGTFGDVIPRLPAIRAMGFDVLYFPPIHPIGTSNRKGPNNTLTPGPDDPGSPYAIGSEEGGHDAIHSQLGTFADFQKLRAAASANGLEIALDFAIQCSPDHPWLKEHPGWFRHRPDGTIKYAENPPKKYQDIVNVDFYADEALPELWVALRDIVMFWVGEGIRLFRVDNPHTKPLPFWEWLIASVRAKNPDVLFLAEAFTRPKMMYRLGKVGFSQSYTYFTWRNTKQELTEYLTELTTTEAADFYRPHFFVNTPDINPIFLQSSGRAGFLIRAALATTLSGLWGMYSGFELCEAAPMPGREEYLDSEKYQIRVRDYAAPGNIVAEITALNRIRKANPALQTHLGITFYNAFNDSVMVYGKSNPGGHDMVLVAVSLDPHYAQDAAFEIPLWEWDLPDNASVAVEDLMNGTKSLWTGKLQRVRLDPARLPFAIWRIAPITGGA